MLRTLVVFSLTLTVSLSFVTAAEPLVRIRDITQVAGEHSNQITGMGLVIGLAGTGGDSQTTKQFALNLLQKMGNRAGPLLRENILRSQEKTDNMSVVIVNALLSPHAKSGQRIDVTVAAFDNAESLTGGNLVATELYGPDGEVYAIAAGPISLNGRDFSGNAANVTKNHPTTGRVPMGGTVEAEEPCTVFKNGIFELLLRAPHYLTAMNIANAINLYSPGSAIVRDAERVHAHVLDIIGVQSVSLEQINRLQTRTEDLQLSEKIQYSETVSADITESVTRLQEITNLQQFTMAAVSQLMTPNLLNYIN